MANVEGESHGAARLDAAIPLDGYVAPCEHASIHAARLRYRSRISGQSLSYFQEKPAGADRQACDCSRATSVGAKLRPLGGDNYLGRSLTIGLAGGEGSQAA
ncbi:hypothetical protein B0G80_4770 [Paraburkholderia sp. BL6669N2]|nr:hypothetical protein B0G80_4770 [Paraburkholderia sp. BL6669N2]